MAGGTVSHYEIIEKLGEGGMGCVYKARDSHLDRIVALKVLPAERVADPERRRRFIQEARAASALNHPNIVTIYDVDEAAGVHFIAMEYVPGKSLDQWIPRKGLPLHQALKFAIQTADALAKAHAAGIVHRDLKPSNIMVGEEDQVKVVDFGLAKLTESSESSQDEPTRTLGAATVEGAIVGSVPYMSPEQAEGKKVDARSDIFSFGAVLYEMVTGRRAFAGGSQASTLAAVIKENPKPAGEVTPGVPRDLEKLIVRCLQKQPDRRWQSMADLKVALYELREESDSQTGAATISPAKQRHRRRWAGAAVLALLIVGGWLLWRRGTREIPAPQVVQLTSYAGSERSPSFSPDGSQVAFSWGGEKGDNLDIYVKLVGEANALRLTSDPAPDVWPAWSPDGRRIAFQRSLPSGAAGIYLVSALGGAERKLADLPAFGQMSWSPDGKWLAFARGSLAPGGTAATALWLLPVEGGEPRQISKPKPPGFDLYPALSPDGRRLAYAACAGTYSCDLYLQPLGSDYVPRGSPRRLTQQTFWIGGLTWSRDGVSLIYGGSPTAGMLRYLWRVNADGDHPPERLDLAGVQASDPAMAPTGHRLAFSRLVQNYDLWRYQTGGEPEPFVMSSLDEMNPQFSPDGKKVAFASARSGEAFEIWVVNSDGSNPVQMTNRLGRLQGSPTWSPDGRMIAFDSQGEDGHWHIYGMEASGGPPRRITAETADENMPSWSRDGKWIYFQSNRSGSYEVWRAPSGGGQAEKITHNSGHLAFESADGKTLFYLKSNNSPLFAQPLAGGAERQVIDWVDRRSFVVVEDGIYYIGAPEADRRYPLRFLQFASGTSRVLTRISGWLFWGLTVSPDRKTFVFIKSETFGSDLMLIENFR